MGVNFGARGEEPEDEDERDSGLLAREATAPASGAAPVAMSAALSALTDTPVVDGTRRGRLVCSARRRRRRPDIVVEVVGGRRRRIESGKVSMLVVSEH